MKNNNLGRHLLLLFTLGSHVKLAYVEAKESFLLPYEREETGAKVVWLSLSVKGQRKHFLIAAMITENAD